MHGMSAAAPETAFAWTNVETAIHTPFGPKARGQSPSSKKNIPRVFNKFRLLRIDTGNGSAILIAVNQSDDKRSCTNR